MCFILMKSSLKMLNQNPMNLSISNDPIRKDLVHGDIPIADCNWNDVIHLCPVDMKIVISQIGSKLVKIQETNKEGWVPIDIVIYLIF